MHVTHAALLKLKHAALFLIMQLVLGLIMLCVDLARLRLPLIISLLPKKTAPVFLTQFVCIIFLSASQRTEESYLTVFLVKFIVQL